MTILGVDYVILNNGLIRLSQICSKLNEETGRIARIYADLDIFWDGDANAAYTVRIADDLVEMGIIMLRARQTIKAAAGMMEIYMKTERDIKRLSDDLLRR